MAFLFFTDEIHKEYVLVEKNFCMYEDPLHRIGW